MNSKTLFFPRKKKERKKEKAMVVPLCILKAASRWLFSFYRAARKIKNCFFFLHKTPSSRPTLPPQPLPLPLSSPAADRRLAGEKDYSFLFNFHSALLQSPSPFPFFMAVAFEGGGPLRAAALLLLTFPVTLFLAGDGDLAVRVMAFVTFCGMRRGDLDVVVRAVMPRVYLAVTDRRCYEAAAAAGRRVVVSGLPEVMVKGFVEECFGACEVVGPELEVVGGRYFTGRLRARGTVAERLAAVNGRFCKEKADFGVVNLGSVNDQQMFIPFSKEVYTVAWTKAADNSPVGDDGNTTPSTNLPRKKYPKTLIFHDGRLAFLPTRAASLSLLLWLPFAATLSVVRILIGVILPYNLSLIIGAALGVSLRVRHTPSAVPRSGAGAGVLFVCTHRTLLDPIFLSHALGRPIPVVTYSLSRFSELLSPIPTVRLTRDRRRDAGSMRRLLSSGDLAVCPEGTTCREPYLLRFSPLFAELAVDIEPVGIDVHSTMFYGTTATGRKWLDPIFFFMNPRPRYTVRFLGRVPTERTVAGGLTPAEVANGIQRQLAEELGFQCTALTRRDKYILLAGNDGVARSPSTTPEKY